MRGEKVMIELATLFMLEATIILGSQLTGYYRPARTQSVSKTRILFSLDIVNKAGRTRCCEVRDKYQMCDLHCIAKVSLFTFLTGAKHDTEGYGGV